MEYNAQFFIDFYTPIPDERWGTRDFYNRETQCYCAFGFLGARIGGQTEEVIALEHLLIAYRELSSPYYPNRLTTANDKQTRDFPQTTPKARVLAYLEECKRKGL